MSVAINKLRQAYKAEQAARLRVAMILKDHFPVGSAVSWTRGGRRQSGTVLHAASWSDSLIARNSRTGKEVKISAFDILSATGGGDA